MAVMVVFVESDTPFYRYIASQLDIFALRQKRYMPSAFDMIEIPLVPQHISIREAEYRAHQRISKIPSGIYIDDSIVC